jgi:hypothetical protein
MGTFFSLRREQDTAYIHKMRWRFEQGLNICVPFWTLFDLMEKFQDSTLKGISLPSHAIACAQLAAEEKEPDWFIVMCLIQHFGKGHYLLGGGTTRDGVSSTHPWGLIGEIRILCTEWYEPECGLEHTHHTFGHSEIIYKSLVRMRQTQRCQLPEEALFILRWQDLLSWHSNGQHLELENQGDKQFKVSVQRFAKLQYRAAELLRRSNSKSNSECILQETRSLVKQYFPIETFEF